MCTTTVIINVMPTDPRTTESYNLNADVYNHHVSNPDESPYHTYYEKPAIRAALPELTDLNVLSIGCGSGVDSRWLKDNGAKNVFGVDISDGLINIAKENNLDIDFTVMDMERLDFEDESFDLTYSSLAIHYLNDWTKALQEANRVLKPGGQYIFSCSHPVDSALERTKDVSSKSAYLGRITNLETSERTMYGDYLAVKENGSKAYSSIAGNTEIWLYHQPVSKMMEYIRKAGFSIETMIEPLPLPEMQQKFPEYYEQLNLIPAFMIWVLKKD